MKIINFIKPIWHNVFFVFSVGFLLYFIAVCLENKLPSITITIVWIVGFMIDYLMNKFVDTEN